MTKPVHANGKHQIENIFELRDIVTVVENHKVM